jgi:hypothetical protein
MPCEYGIIRDITGTTCGAASIPVKSSDTRKERHKNEKALLITEVLLSVPEQAFAFH